LIFGGAWANIPYSIKVGAVAQLGERLNGIQEADGSIPFSSTRIYRGLARAADPLSFFRHRGGEISRIEIERGSIKGGNGRDRTKMKSAMVYRVDRKTM
jgi:hypothetical protein